MRLLNVPKRLLRDALRTGAPRPFRDPRQRGADAAGAALAGRRRDDRGRRPRAARAYRPSGGSGGTRTAATLALALGLAVGAGEAVAGGLFEDEAVLDVTLRGPVSEVVGSRSSREEMPFTLRAAGHELPVKVRVRGHSRLKLCRFPPLRLNFSAEGTAGTPFEGLDKVKLVTHCKHGDRATDALWNEYLAYRIFNQLSAASYRVRLLQVQYEDAGGGRPERFPAFLIEPAPALAARLGGAVVSTQTLHYADVDEQQLARVAVFEYLIGNSDWSLGRAQDQDECCHNVDLVDAGGAWQPVPYDFDLSVLVEARYRGPFAVRQAARREYLGYCRSPRAVMAAALGEALAGREAILALAREVPAAGAERLERRLRFLETFFETDPAEALDGFERACRGRR